MDIQRSMLMSLTISIEEAQATLADLIGKLGPGEEVVITKDAQPVAELRSLATGGVSALSRHLCRTKVSSLSVPAD